MLVSATSPFKVGFARNGGTIITARIDYWSATPGGWALAGSNVFQNVVKPNEGASVKLKPGQYTAVFTCRVEESINGVFDFGFDVDATRVFSDHGNVNTSPDPRDAKAYKDQFVLDVA